MPRNTGENPAARTRKPLCKKSQWNNHERTTTAGIQWTLSCFYRCLQYFKPLSLRIAAFGASASVGDTPPSIDFGLPVRYGLFWHVFFCCTSTEKQTYHIMATKGTVGIRLADYDAFLWALQELQIIG